MTNFHTSWKDGLAFCAILDRHRPDLLNYDLCDPDTPLSNLEMAMSVAEKELGIVRIIDPEGGWFQLLPVAYWGTWEPTTSSLLRILGNLLPLYIIVY